MPPSPSPPASPSDVPPRTLDARTACPVLGVWVWVERLRTLSLSTAEWEAGQSHGASLQLPMPTPKLQSRLNSPSLQLHTQDERVLPTPLSSLSCDSSPCGSAYEIT